MFSGGHIFNWAMAQGLITLILPAYSFHCQPKSDNDFFVLCHVPVDVNKWTGYNMGIRNWSFTSCHKATVVEYICFIQLCCFHYELNKVCIIPSRALRSCPHISWAITITDTHQFEFKLFKTKISWILHYRTLRLRLMKACIMPPYL